MGGLVPETISDDDQATHFRKPPTNESVDQVSGLKLITNFHTAQSSTQAPSDSQHSYSAVSMVPTPVLTQSVGSFLVQSSSTMDEADPDDRISHSSRAVSASLVPDQLDALQSPIGNASNSTLHQNMLKSPESVASVPTKPVQRAESLVIPKRSQSKPQLEVQRSVSVGGPQRQPSTILHRELKTTSVESPVSLPKELYMAQNPQGLRTAWTRVKFVGKGSFSDVVLAKPALEHVKPEYVDEVRSGVEKELAALDNTSEPLDTTGKPPKKSNLLVAVKITTLKPGKSSTQLEYFKRDLEIMVQIPTHPCLMKLIGCSIDETLHKRAIYVLSFCSGGDLFDLVAKYRSRLSCMLIRRLFADVCSAVVFLHSNMIVHRDIKLENVLIDVKVSQLLAMEHPEKYEGSLAVVTDLGLARRIDPKSPMLTTRCGSDDYVPPEILLGQPYDGRETDSWALGVLLYAMLEGRLPFDVPPNQASLDRNRQRIRTAHRIARVDWTWYKRKSAEEIWLGGLEVVESCLQRRGNRRIASKTLQMPWVAEALPQKIYDTHDVTDLWKLFVQ